MTGRFKQGWRAPRLREQGVPTIDDPACTGHSGRFDIVTAMEVNEHTGRPRRRAPPDPYVAQPWRAAVPDDAERRALRLESWRYMTPEVHISFFEPATLTGALGRAGFPAKFPGFGPGWPDIIRYKVLMSLHRKWTSPLEWAVPWTLLAGSFDSRLRLSAQALGWARDEGDTGQGPSPLRRSSSATCQ